jgi:hypothetical protein
MRGNVVVIDLCPAKIPGRSLASETLALGTCEDEEKIDGGTSVF